MPNPNDTPTSLVLQMRQQGLSNNQLVQILQREGYNQTQIFDALNQADAKGSIEGIPQGYMQGAGNVENPMTGPMQTQNQNQQQGYQTYQTNDSSGAVGYEELIESVIEEKWNELTVDINKIIKWKDGMEDRIAKMEQKMVDLKSSFDLLHQAVVGKIGEYDKHILDIGSEIQAMEQVFKKVLPAFTENVNELSRISKNLKK